MAWGFGNECVNALTPSVEDSPFFPSYLILIEHPDVHRHHIGVGQECLHGDCDGH